LSIYNPIFIDIFLPFFANIFPETNTTGEIRGQDTAFAHAGLRDLWLPGKLPGLWFGFGETPAQFAYFTVISS
jgi:hypothetical protein